LPRSLARRLRAAGFDVAEVRDVGLRGQSDETVFIYAQANRFVLLTADVGLGTLLRFPLRTHPGIVVVRFPNEISHEAMNDAILTALENTDHQEMVGHILIIEPRRVRLRRG
jgi:predicted nuclease of predicted toxin-antitoxin system